ncbi:cupredoxin domain-containing protein [Aromatoleum toluclasticum]|uniref:hypothetical protein n=1 Tax=Aromatoleum toluclasticum TaxID=92003 RepID=UPI0003A4B3C0|nr:hypothetical protein [Aromatoleum toluclasticum]
MPGAASVGAVDMAGDPVEVTRTIEVTMDNSMHVVPDHTTVKAGETVAPVGRTNRNDRVSHALALRPSTRVPI